MVLESNGGGGNVSYVHGGVYPVFRYDNEEADDMVRAGTSWSDLSCKFYSLIRFKLFSFGTNVLDKMKIDVQKHIPERSTLHPSLNPKCQHKNFDPVVTRRAGLHSSINLASKPISNACDIICEKKQISHFLNKKQNSFLERKYHNVKYQMVFLFI